MFISTKCVQCTYTVQGTKMFDSPDMYSVQGTQILYSPECVVYRVHKCYIHLNVYSVQGTKMFDSPECVQCTGHTNVIFT